MRSLIDIRNARKSLGLTLRELAEQVSVSKQALSAYEHGLYLPREEVWTKLKGVLRLTGKVEDYWGRVSQFGRRRIYKAEAKCRVHSCKSKPISRRYCAKHYQSNYWRRKYEAKR